MARVKVGTDDKRVVWTDSTGRFVFNSDANADIGNRAGLTPKRITWLSAGSSIQLPVDSDAFGIELRNLAGKLILSYSAEQFRSGSSLSLPDLPMGLYSLSVRSDGKITARRTSLIRGPSQLVQSGTAASVNKGMGKSASVRTAVFLKFTKPTYYPSERAFAGSQENLVIPLREDFSPTRHDFLSAAEWQCTPDWERNQKMCIVRGGKVVWTYTEPLPCEFRRCLGAFG